MSEAKSGPGFPQGHLNHLSSSQNAAFEQFKKLAEEQGLYRGPADGQSPSHNDATMLRYLRARKFQPDAALGQFTSTEKWRKENALTELYDNIDAQEYEDTRRLYPQWVGRRDKRGLPVYVFEVKSLSSKAITAYETANTLKGVHTNSNTPVKMLKLFALYENLCQFVTPWCTAMTDRPYPDTPITQGNNIIDISGTGLKQFWDLKAHLQDSSTLATANYPETLDRIFIIGAPSFFPRVWSWVKGWFDPVVVAKMFILSQSEVYKVLSEHIDPSSIPKKYGGQLDWAWGDLPNVDPEMLADFKEPANVKLRIGPSRWEKSEDGKMRLLAVGSEDGQPRRVPLGVLKRHYDAVFDSRQGEGSKPNGDSAPPTVSTDEPLPAPRASALSDRPRPSTDSTPSVSTTPGPPVR